MAVTAFIGGALRLSFFASAISGGQTITAPNNLRDGDWFGLLDMAVRAAAIPPPADVPTDFDIYINSTLSNARMLFSGRIAEAADSGDALSGMLGTVANSTSKTPIVIRGSKPITAVNVVANTGEVTPGDPSAQTVDATAGVTPLIVFGLYGRFTSPGVEAIVPTFTISGNAAAEQFLTSPSGGGKLTETTIGYRRMNTNGQRASVLADMGDSGIAADANALQSCRIEFSAD